MKKGLGILAAVTAIVLVALALTRGRPAASRDDRPSAATGQAAEAPDQAPMAPASPGPAVPPAPLGQRRDRDPSYASFYRQQAAGPQVPSFTPQERLLGGALPVLSADGPPDAKGRFRRVSLVKAEFKYPLLRVVSSVRPDPHTGTEREETEAVMVADHILVKLGAGATEDDLRALNRRTGATLRKALHTPGLYLVAFGPPDLDLVPRQVEAYRAATAVIAYAEPDHVGFANAVFPNDPRFAECFGLHNTGQTGGIPDADIDAPEAWDLATGDRAVVVGVIDTGIDYTHEDIAANMWVHPGEVPGNGIDDDGNGFVDDIHGWDFANDDNDPYDDGDHGTHVSGTIAAVGDNGIGVAGVSWSAQLMALKWILGSGSGVNSDAVDCVNYATMMRQRGINLRLTNNSWRFFSYSQSLLDALTAAEAADLLFVASAGNDSEDSDLEPHYPSSYALDSVLSVASTTDRDELSGFSNYGALSVDLAAPGSSILSSIPGDRYALFSGTSMASPHVSGAAALLWSVAPNATFRDIRAALLEGVDPIPAMTGRAVTGGRLNARRSLELLGMFVRSSMPAQGMILDTAPATFQIEFSDAFDPASLQAPDLVVNGMSADTVVTTSPNEVVFQFGTTPVTAEGLQTMAMAEDAVIRTLDGDGVKAWAATFRYDVLRLAVTNTVPADGANVLLPLTSLRIEFNEALDAASVGVDDLVLNQGVVSAAVTVDVHTVEYTLAGVAEEGTLEITLAEGAVTDGHGNPNLAYTGHFDLDFGTLPVSDGFARVPPDGSLVYVLDVAGQVAPGSDVDAFTLDLDADQALSVSLVPQPGFRAALGLRDPSAGVVASSTASAPGAELLLQSVPVSVGGSYTLEVSGVDGSTGGYALTVHLNAAYEQEAHDGPANDSASLAEDLDPVYIPLGPGVTKASVLGAAGGPPAVPPIAFETEPNDDGTAGGSSADLPFANAWNGSFSASVPGRYRAALQGAIATGNDGDWDFYRITAAPGDVLVIDLKGAPSGAGTLSDPYLRLYDRYGVEIAGNDDWSGLESHLEYDAFAYEGDYFVVADSYGSSAGSYTLEAETTSPLNGRTPGADWFSFTLADNAAADLILAGIGGHDVMLELYLGSNLLAVTVDDPGAQKSIRGFKADSPGTYHVRVAGRDDYHLVATRRTAFANGLNSVPERAQDITISQRVLGRVNSGRRLFALPLDESSAIVELDPDTGAERRRIPAPEPAGGPDCLAYSGGSLFLYNTWGSQTLWELDPDTGAILDADPMPAALAESDGMTGLDGLLYLLDFADADIAVFDPVTDTLLSVLDIDALNPGTALVGGLAAISDPRALVATDDVGRRIVEIDPGTGLITAEFTPGTPAAGDYISLAVIGQQLYLGSYTLNTLDVFDRDGSWVRSMGMPYGISGLTTPPLDGSAGSWFAVQVNTGDALEVSTTTPADGPLQFENNLDPALALFAPDGSLQGTDDNSAPDGRNTLLTHLAATAGTYRVQVASALETEGEFLLSLAGATGDPLPFDVAGTLPEDGAALGTAPAQLRVDFSAPLSPLSLDAADLQVDGVPALAVTLLDGDTAAFDLPLLDDGTHSLSLAAGSILDLAGIPLEAFAMSFVLDLTPPRVTSSSIQEGELVAGSGLTFTAVFSEPMRTNLIDASDVLLEGSVEGSIAPAAFQYLPSNQILSVTFPDLLEDAYTLTVFSGTNAFADLVGHALDGETLAWPIPPNPSGDGADGGDFRVSFVVDVDRAPWPADFRVSPPLGVMVYEASTRSQVYPAGDVDRYVVSLDANQALSAVAAPEGSVRPMLELHAPDGSLLGSAAAASGGEPAVLSPVPVAASGAYTVTVRGADASIGPVRLGLLLNAAYEVENFAGTGNDTPAGAEELDTGATVVLGSSIRSAVAGNAGTFAGAPPILNETEPNDDGTTGGSAADLPYANDWSGSFVPLGGNRYQARLDGEISRGSDVDWDFFRILAGPGDVFAVGMRGAGSGVGTLFDTYLRLYDDQGTQLAFDDDGGAFAFESLLVYSNFTYRGSYYLVADSFGANAGTYTLEATNTTQQVVLPVAAGEDWFRFALAEAEDVSLVLGATVAGLLGMELYGPDGATLLTVGYPSQNSAALINGFLAPAAGTYYARVTGEAAYTLALLRGARFEEEDNRDPAKGALAPGEGHVLGYLDEGELGRLYVYDATANLIRELNPETGVQLNAFASPVGEAGGPDLGLATSADALLAGGTSRQPIHVLDPDTGATLRTLPNPGLEVSGIAYLDGEVFLLTDTSGDITVIDYQDGSVLRTLNITLPISECLGGDGTRLFSLLANLLIAIDPQTGATTEVGPLVGGGEGLGVIGDELFVAGDIAVGVFDLETLALKRVLDGVDDLEALGADGGAADRDFVRFDVIAGDDLALSTATPGDGPLDFDNVLDPMLELYDPAGNLVATDDNGAPDGRNAEVSHNAATSGVYAALVLPAGRSKGEFVLNLSGASGPGAAFRVTVTDPVDGASLPSAPASVELMLSDTILLSSVDAGDLQVNGLPAIAVTVVQDRTLVFDLPPTTAGHLDVTLAAGALTSLGGRPVEPFAASYTVAGPRVVETSIQEGQVVAPGIVPITITFDRRMDNANLDPADFLLEGDVSGSVDPIRYRYEIGATSTMFYLTYDGLTDDAYTLTLLSGDGRFEDEAGYDLDGEPSASPIPPGVSGDGVAGGDFARHFAVDAAIEPLPSTFIAHRPLGGLVYEASIAGVIQNAIDTDGYTFTVAAGQTLTVVPGSGPSLVPEITLEDDLPGGDPPAHAVDALIQTEPVIETAEWTLTVAGSGGSTGTYEVAVLLNAAVEEEPYTGLSNDTAAAAQDLDGSAIPVGEGAAARYAVTGRLPLGPARVLHRENFERGVLNSAWDIASSEPGGRIRVTGERGAASGAFALLMDREGSGDDTLNEAVWTVDLDDLSGAVLELQHAEWYDEDHPFAADFNGHANADGVAISDDGVNWHPVLDSPGQPSRRWFPHSVDLAAAAADAGMTLGPHFRIKLQQFDNGTLPLDGRGWDELAIYVPEPDQDWYALSLEAGRDLALVLASPTGSTAHVDLFAEDGTTLLASGHSPEPGAEVIDSFVVPGPGKYLVRVRGTAETYDLVVAGDISFDIEPNALSGEFREVSRTGRAMGHVSTAEKDGFVFEVAAGDSVELTAWTPFAGPPGVEHGLMPNLVLIAPGGTTQQVAYASPGGVAGLSHLAAEDGLHLVTVGSATNAGEYELMVTGATGVPAADLVVWHAAMPGASDVGCRPHFVVTVSNRGPSVATGCVLTYEMDPALSTVSKKATQGGVSGDSTLWWGIGTLDVGQMAVLDLGVVVEGPGMLSNLAGVVANEVELNITNNLSLAETWVLDVGTPSQHAELVSGTPLVLDPPGGPDQNRVGETLDLNRDGGSQQSVNTCASGSHAGRVYFNYDETHLYLGGEEVDTLAAGNRVILFLGLNTLAHDFRNAAGKVGLPVALNLLDNLVIEDPADIAIVLGDEYGDETDPDAGQGVYQLGGLGFQPVDGARIAQFDGSGDALTTTADDDGDRLTDRWEVAIPWSALNAPSGIVSVSSLRVAAIVVGGNEDTRGYIYSAYLGLSAEGVTNLEGDFGFEEVHLKAAVVSLPDRDDDGLPDWWETLHGLDAGDDGSTDPINGPAGDPDGDDATNAEELAAGTDPHEIASVFAIAEMSVSPANASVVVLTQPGQRYEIEYRDGGLAGPGAWKPFANRDDGVGTWTEEAATPTNFIFMDDFTPATSGSAPTGTPSRAYRVQTEGK